MGCQYIRSLKWSILTLVNIAKGCHRRAALYGSESKIRQTACGGYPQSTSVGGKSSNNEIKRIQTCICTKFKRMQQTSAIPFSVGTRPAHLWQLWLVLKSRKTPEPF